MPRKHPLLPLLVGALLGVAWFAGCASRGPLHPALAPASEASASVVLVRDAGGERSKAPVQVLLDDQPIAALVAGHWTRLRVRPGVHVFAAAAAEDPERRPGFQSTQPGYVRETTGVGPSAAARLELAAGETRYLLLRYDRTDSSGQREGQGMVRDTRILFALEQMAESTARGRMEEYREVSVEHP